MTVDAQSLHQQAGKNTASLRNDHSEARHKLKYISLSETECKADGIVVGNVGGAIVAIEATEGNGRYVAEEDVVDDRTGSAPAVKLAFKNFGNIQLAFKPFTKSRKIGKCQDSIYMLRFSNVFHNIDRCICAKKFSCYFFE